MKTIKTFCLKAYYKYTHVIAQPQLGRCETQLLSPRTDYTKQLSDIKGSLQTITKQILEIKNLRLKNTVLSMISELTEKAVQKKC